MVVTKMDGEKLKLAFYWAASCGGCEIAVLDIDEKILDVLEIADIVFWPVALDTKYAEVEKMPDKSIDVCFFNGAIRTEENEHLAKLLRKKSKILIAFGSCACYGGIPGLANLWNKKEIFRRVYLETESTRNPGKTEPTTKTKITEGELTLPRFYDTVKTLEQTVDVDYFIPGCPPPKKLILQAIEAIATKKLPEKGSYFASNKSVCDECKREREEKNIPKILRRHQAEPDPEKCLLDQGIICMGPATRGGCDAMCLKANMPCTGCLGPCPGVTDQGAAMISALASVMGLDREEKMSEEDVRSLMEQVVDPVGIFY
ncbi:MAG: oxidoreductase, partial [Methanobacteriota archaeon]